MVSSKMMTIRGQSRTSVGEGFFVRLVMHWDNESTTKVCHVSTVMQRLLLWTRIIVTLKSSILSQGQAFQALSI